jgi:acylphosphatase
MRGRPSRGSSTPTHRATRSSADPQAATTLGQRVTTVIRYFRVTGKVQGVYFRHSTRLEAERLGIRGVARNMPDGTVEVLAHGDPAAVETLRQWLHRGPALARVAVVEELEAGGDGAPGTAPPLDRFSVE